MQYLSKVISVLELNRVRAEAPWMSMTVKGVTVSDDANFFDSGPILMSSRDLCSCSSVEMWL